MTERPPVPAPPANGLRAVAVWLATRLDDARFYRAAAHAAMTADAIDDESGRADRHEHSRTGDGLSFDIDEHGQVWMMRGGHAHIIGPKEVVLAEMRRVLAGAELREDR